MLHDLLLPKNRKPIRQDERHDRNREARFETLFAKSFADMRARNRKR